MAEPHVDSQFEGLWQAFIMIVVSEIGDKTFLIAAIMATRHPRITVFGGAWASLIVMSILSAAMGRVILGLIPKVYTQYAAALLFLVFGIKMVQEGLKIPSGAAHMQEELREVEDELEAEEAALEMDGRGLKPLEDLEEGSGSGSGGITTSSEKGGVEPIKSATSSSSLNPRKSPSISLSRGAHSGGVHYPLSGGNGSSSSSGAASFILAAKNMDTVKLKNGARNFCSLFFSPVFAQAFILTFLGEWGDRSQIATIALGGANSVAVIAFGTILGHGICTFGAVMGGRYLSTLISVRHITLIGAAAFLFFAVAYFHEAWTSKADASVPGGGW